MPGVEADPEEGISEAAIDDLLEHAAPLADVERPIPLRDRLEVRGDESFDIVPNPGRQAGAILKTPNGYTLTVLAALGIVSKLMAAQRPIGGFYTPSRLMGADYVLRLPGVKRLPGN